MSKDHRARLAKSENLISSVHHGWAFFMWRWNAPHLDWLGPPTLQPRDGLQSPHPSLCFGQSSLEDNGGFLGSTYLSYSLIRPLHLIGSRPPYRGHGDAQDVVPRAKRRDWGGLWWRPHVGAAGRQAGLPYQIRNGGEHLRPRSVARDDRLYDRRNGEARKRLFDGNPGVSMQNSRKDALLV
jgi:hypothetical protein